MTETNDKSVQESALLKNLVALTGLLVPLVERLNEQHEALRPFTKVIGKIGTKLEPLVDELGDDILNDFEEQARTDIKYRKHRKIWDEKWNEYDKLGTPADESIVALRNHMDTIHGSNDDTNINGAMVMVSVVQTNIQKCIDALNEMKEEINEDDDNDLDTLYVIHARSDVLKSYLDEVDGYIQRLENIENDTKTNVKEQLKKQTPKFVNPAKPAG